MNASEFVSKIAAYVQKYAPQYGILVHSPIIAQSILESGRGTSDLAINANNYFGLKYREGRCPTSNGIYVKEGSEQNPDGSYISSVMKWCKFPNMEAGVQGYFDFINNSRYANLKGVTDPETYLKLIREDGYATSINYVENLLNVIESYDLTKYDSKMQEVKHMAKICIDPGHYGKYNRCPAIPEYYESEIMWKLSNLQKAHLEKMGVEVVLTRSNPNKDLALQTRGKKAAGCDLFISNHSNATGSGMNESTDYVAVYHLTDDKTTNADDISAEVAQGIAPLIASVMGTKQGSRVLTRRSGNDRNNDGVLNDNYYGVLHGARLVNVPALIIEHSFHTNSKSVKWLLNEKNLDDLAKAEAAYIASYLKSKAGNASGSAPITPAQTPGNAVSLPYKVRITASALNVRAGAGTQHKANTIVQRGEVYTIIEEINGWGKLKSGAGWISLKYAEVIGTTENAESAEENKAPAQTPGNAVSLPYKVRITASALNVRAGAGTQHKANTIVQRGEVYTIIEEINGWGKLKSGAGWISLQYTERV